MALTSFQPSDDDSALCWSSSFVIIISRTRIADININFNSKLSSVVAAAVDATAKRNEHAYNNTRATTIAKNNIQHTQSIIIISEAPALSTEKNIIYGIYW